MTSSSKRVIKRPETSEKYSIEQYILPKEITLSKQELEVKRPVFPQYTKDSLPKPSSKPKPAVQKEEEASEHIDPEEELRKQWMEDARKELEDAKREAEEILEEAKEQAMKEFEEARREGHREGYEAGYQEGKKTGEEQCREIFQDNLLAFQSDIKQALRSVEIAKENCVRKYLDELKDCAIAIGEKVIHISLRSSGEVIKQMIISATEKLKKTAWVKIYIDKCDYDMMMEADADILDELSHLSDNIKFIVMDKEERGNCIIEMPEEIVDVSVNTQIENIKDILENVRV